MGGVRGVRKILEIGAEGGSLTVLVRHHRDHGREFAVVLDESTLAAIMSEEDWPGDEYRKESPWVSTWDRALELLDQYPWARLFPVFVAPDYQDAVLAAVRERLDADPSRRGMDQKLREWQEAVGREWPD